MTAAVTATAIHIHIPIPVDTDTVTTRARALPTDPTATVDMTGIEETERSGTVMTSEAKRPRRSRRRSRWSFHSRRASFHDAI